MSGPSVIEECGLDEVDAVHVLAALNQNHDAFDEAPQGSNAEGHKGHHKLNDALLGVAEVEGVSPKVTKEDAEKSGDKLALCLTCGSRQGRCICISHALSVARKWPRVNDLERAKIRGARELLRTGRFTCAYARVWV